MSHSHLALALLASLALAACGSGKGDRNRPLPRATLPDDGAVLDNVVAEVAVIYDDDIRILNPDAVWMADSRGRVRVSARVDSEYPRVLRIRTAAGNSFLPGETTILVGAGLVANTLNQYSLEDFSFSFTMGEGPSLFVATHGTNAVAELDRQTFVGVATTPTPGGRPPVGLTATQVLLEVRVWTQLANGGGDGRALAWFRPGEDAMTEVELTRAPGGDLEALYDAVTLSRDGRSIFVAYRDTALQQVRVHEVDVDTATEVTSLILSPPASPTTAPVSLRPGPLNRFLYVGCTSASGDTLNRIRLSTWDEDDIGDGDGVDGQSFESGMGALTGWGETVYTGSRTSPTSLYASVTPSTGGSRVTESPSEIVGNPTGSVLTVDGRWLMQGLDGYEGIGGLVRRLRLRMFDPTSIDVVTDTGTPTPEATRVTTLENFRTELRLLALLDNAVLTTYTWDLLEVFQDDLDPDLEGIQGVDISAWAPQPVDAAFVSGIFLR